MDMEYTFKDKVLIEILITTLMLALPALFTL